MADKENNIKHIVRVVNVDLPGQKNLRVALTKIKGIGQNLADGICRLAGVDRRMKTGALSEKDVASLEEVIKNPNSKGIPVWMFNRRRDMETGEDKHLITGTLNFEHDNDLKRLKKIKSYKGIRHSKRLPVRGQRTRSNFRRGKGKAVGVKKKK